MPRDICLNLRPIWGIKVLMTSVGEREVMIESGIKKTSIARIKHKERRES